jgi:DNA-binding NarL/FixJ family response regulator
MSQRIRVLIADDYPVIRRALCSLLDFEPDLQVVGEAADGEEAIALTAALNPDILILDVDMPGKSGLEALDEIRQQQLQTQVLLYTGLTDQALLHQALQNGASGYLPKSASVLEVVDAIRSVHQAQPAPSPANGIRNTAPARTPLAEGVQLRSMRSRTKPDIVLAA